MGICSSMGKQPANGFTLCSLVERHGGLALGLAVVAVLGVDGVEVRLELAHLRHVLEAGGGERVEHQLHQEGEQDDGEAPVAHQVEDGAQQPDQALGDEREPAEVHGRGGLVPERVHGVQVLGAHVDGGANQMVPAGLELHARVAEGGLEERAHGLRASTVVHPHLAALGGVVFGGDERGEVLVGDGGPTGARPKPAAKCEGLSSSSSLRSKRSCSSSPKKHCPKDAKSDGRPRNVLPSASRDT
jgi:hypothetical protein